MKGLPPDIAKLLDSGEIEDPAGLAQAINAQKKARLESELLDKNVAAQAQSPPIPQKPGVDNKSPEIPQKPIIPQKPGVENGKSPEIPQKPSINFEYPPVEGEYIEKPKKTENVEKKETKPSIDFEYPPVDGEFIETPKKRVKSTREKSSKSKSGSGENKRKSVSSEQIGRVKKQKEVKEKDSEYPPIEGEFIPKPKESSGEFIEKPKSDDALQRKKQVETSPALPPAKPVAKKKQADFTNSSQGILQKSLPNIPLKPEKPPAIPSKLNTPQPVHVTPSPAPVANTPPPLLPPKPGTQKVIGKNYRPAAPGVCPDDIYRSLGNFPRFIFLPLFFRLPIFYTKRKILFYVFPFLLEGKSKPSPMKP